MWLTGLAVPGTGLSGPACTEQEEGAPGPRVCCGASSWWAIISCGLSMPRSTVRPDSWGRVTASVVQLAQLLEAVALRRPGQRRRRLGVDERLSLASMNPAWLAALPGMVDLSRDSRTGPGPAASTSSRAARGTPRRLAQRPRRGSGSGSTSRVDPFHGYKNAIEEQLGDACPSWTPSMW